jgi:polyphosphate kinase 2 (PPK2 family)
MAGRKLATNVWVAGRFFAAGSTPDKEYAEQITNPKAWGEDTDTESSDATTYSSMKVDDLKAEIESRNEGRDEDAQLSTEGKKADLIAVLEADDAANG